MLQYIYNPMKDVWGLYDIVKCNDASYGNFFILRNNRSKQKWHDHYLLFISQYIFLSEKIHYSRYLSLHQPLK